MEEHDPCWDKLRRNCVDEEAGFGSKERIIGKEVGLWVKICNELVQDRRLCELGRRSNRLLWRDFRTAVCNYRDLDSTRKTGILGSVERLGFSRGIDLGCIPCRFVLKINVKLRVVSFGLLQRQLYLDTC